MKSLSAQINKNEVSVFYCKLATLHNMLREVYSTNLYEKKNIFL